VLLWKIQLLVLAAVTFHIILIILQDPLWFSLSDSESLAPSPTCESALSYFPPNPECNYELSAPALAGNSEPSSELAECCPSITPTSTCRSSLASPSVCSLPKYFVSQSEYDSEYCDSQTADDAEHIKNSTEEHKESQVHNSMISDLLNHFYEYLTSPDSDNRDEKTVYTILQVINSSLDVLALFVSETIF